ncbi:outer membrane beta-barrel protein [Salinimicrobium sp. TH3]|uniref:outer membrane beta-barrel protein n=1 Tax=Salinimicrobium sp. TH3 TaxID=2997342 RepID=UPI002274336A|nr:outer membrane beta-barrel protein [Salinimicrobium sp. TH3]MCY2688474.1 outer membrane beta-barrel protein [Salinimicrobium sp. TH3]
MNKNLLLVLMILIGYGSYAQINYEPGYFLDNQGKRHEVLIKNFEWRNNPSMIEYKTSQNSEIMTASIADIQEFRIGEFLKYTRQTVQLDQSSDNLKSLSRTGAPEFKEETVFLKVLIEGQADLYQFTDDVRNRFLFSVNDGPVEQLVFKQYQSSTGNQRKKNNQFRQQLLNNLSCSELGLQDVERLGYSEKTLRSFFKEYHSCTGADYVEYGILETGEKGALNLKIKLGLNQAPLEIEREGSMYAIGHQVKLDMEPSFRIGLEAEYVFPWNKNKWSVFIEPVYQQVKGEKEFNYVSYNPDKVTTFTVDYSMISVPVGLRHYFFLNDDSRLFVNAAYVFNSYVNSNVSDSEEVYFHEMAIRNNSHTVDIGAGYSFRNKFGIEVRYGLPREIFADHSSTSQSPTHGDWKAVNHSFVSLILGYTIF